MSAAPDRLPLPGLLALATAGFVTILTEALPAGLLPQIGKSLGVGEGLAGQWISVYALGSLVAAIPLMAATRTWRRRQVLLFAIVGFALANGVTAITDSFTVGLGARFVGGMSAGMVWALLAGYAVRMAPKPLAGRAMAIAMAGTPLALSIGIPAAIMLGTLASWRTVFTGLSGMALLLAGWIIRQLPDFPGEAASNRLSLRHVLALPGIGSVLLLTFTFVLAHNILYTYIAPVLDWATMARSIEQVLLTFGIAGLVGILATGTLIDRHLRLLISADIALFAAAAILFLARPSSGGILLAAALWGLGFGGAATVFQTASARAAGPAADIAQAMIVTVWNLAMASGAIAGGALLDSLGAGVLPLATALLLVVSGLSVFRTDLGPS